MLVGLYRTCSTMHIKGKSNCLDQCSRSGSPDLVPPDPYVFGPPGSISQRYLIRIRIWIWNLLSSLSKNSTKNLDSYLLNVPSKSNKQKNFWGKISFLLASWRSMTKIAGSGSISQRLGSPVRIRIHTKMSWIWNTSLDAVPYVPVCFIEFRCQKRPDQAV